MAKQYYSVLTTYGSQQLATAIASNQPLNITHFAVGDGNGQTVMPNMSRTALVNEVHRAKISAVSRDPRNNKQVIFELTIPENVGGFHIREMGIFDNQNKLIAYANCPESFKPTLDSGSGKVQVMRMILLIESSDAVTMKIDNTVIFGTREQLNPKTITESSTNVVDENGHSHQIAKASTTVRGIVKLTDELNLNDSTIAATAKAVKTLADRIAQAIRMLSNYIPNSKKSSAVNSDSEDTIGTSKAVKLAYERAIEAEKKGLPVGAIVAFHKSANPIGYLRAIGGTFNRETYPDLYVANGNSNILPNLHRSDVGMTAYFAVDEIPDGWIAFDGIHSMVTQQRYPELYQHLVTKYGSISQVPIVEDRFIRNAVNDIDIGQKQEGTLVGVDSIDGGAPFSPFLKSIATDYKKTADKVGLDIVKDISKYDAGLGWAEGQWVGKGRNHDLSIVATNPDAQGHFVGVARPHSITFKLCIKANNSFDDVKFWIKAFGSVENAGNIDVSKLAQNLQKVERENQQEFLNFKNRLDFLENKIQDVNESKIIWAGNVSNNSLILQTQESMLNKKLTLYLQSSSEHSLNTKYNAHIATVYVDKKIMNISGKKYIHTAMYAGGWRNVQIEIISENQFKVIDISGFYLKQITAI